jgi:hypothetical protein
MVTLRFGHLNGLGADKPKMAFPRVASVLIGLGAVASLAIWLAAALPRHPLWQAYLEADFWLIPAGLVVLLSVAAIGWSALRQGRERRRTRSQPSQ